MSKHLIVWAGPVSESKLKNVKWSTPVDILTINHGINANYNCAKYWQLSQADIPKCIGSNAFASLASSYPKSGKLKAMAAAAGIDVNNYSRICLCGFSAAHGMNNPILEDSKSRKLVTGFLAMDSYYGGMKEGYLKFVNECTSGGDKAMIATTSPFGGPANMPYKSSYEAIKPFLQKVGVKPFTDEKLTAAINKYIGINTSSEWARNGNFVYGNYPGAVGHAKHVDIGVYMLEHVISPWMTKLDGNKPLFEQSLLSSSGTFKTVAIVGGVILLVGGASALAVAKVTGRI